MRDIPPTHAGASDGGMTRSADGIQWVQGLGGSRIEAGTTERGLAREALIARWRHTRLAEVQQVHGGAVAALLGPAVPHAPIAGCDALVTTVPALALVIRTADCLPVFFADAARGVIGLAHVGWRGVAAELPARVVAVFRHGFFSAPQGLRATIGPCIRACCYDVGPEFTPPHGSPARACGQEGEFPKGDSPKPRALARGAGFTGALAPFVRERAGRRTCDLVGATKAQLEASGVRGARIVDSGECTACHPQRWYSLRREGPDTGRLVSFIRLRP